MIIELLHFLNLCLTITEMFDRAILTYIDSWTDERTDHNYKKVKVFPKNWVKAKKLWPKNPDWRYTYFLLIWPNTNSLFGHCNICPLLSGDTFTSSSYHFLLDTLVFRHILSDQAFLWIQGSHPLPDKNKNL